MSKGGEDIAKVLVEGEEQEQKIIHCILHFLLNLFVIVEHIYHYLFLYKYHIYALIVISFIFALILGFDCSVSSIYLFSYIFNSGYMSYIFCSDTCSILCSDIYIHALILSSLLL